MKEEGLEGNVIVQEQGLNLSKWNGGGEEVMRRRDDGARRFGSLVFGVVWF